jgi:hypothetical protein
MFQEKILGRSGQDPAKIRYFFPEDSKNPEKSV